MKKFFLFSTVLAGLMLQSCDKSNNPRLTNEESPIHFAQDLKKEAFKQDSLALVDFYWATEGDGWSRRNGWLSTSKELKDWRGVELDIVDGQLRVVALNLGGNKLDGSIPKEIAKLTALKELRLDWNKDLKGSIPEELYKLKELKVLSLGFTALQGELSPKIAQLSQLDTLNLRTSPWDLAPLKQAEAGKSTFVKNPTVLTGALPKEIGQLKSLRYLNLGRQGFSGALPEEIGELTALTHLDIVTNKLSGRLPESLSKLKNLRVLNLGHNAIEGEIPSSIGELVQLETLNLRNNKLSGTIPSSLVKLQKVWKLFLSDNELTGELPKELAEMKALEIVFLHNNQLEGALPSNLAGAGNPRLGYIDLDNNNFTGSLPKAVLHKWYAGSKHIKDDKSAGYTHFSVVGNRMTGTIPAEYLQVKSELIDLGPQQEGYGFENFKLEEAKKYAPKSKYDEGDLVDVPNDWE